MLILFLVFAAFLAFITIALQRVIQVFLAYLGGDASLVTGRAGFFEIRTSQEFRLARNVRNAQNKRSHSSEK
jgi:hypothetical protein